MSPVGSPVAERLESLRREFALDATRARQLIGRFREEMLSGVAGEKNSLKMLSLFTRDESSVGAAIIAAMAQGA